MHFIGAGVLLAEFQQSSDLTYRIHDWGRPGRELHIEKAVRALSWKRCESTDLRRRGPGPHALSTPWPFETEQRLIASPTPIGGFERDTILLPLVGRGALRHALGRWEIVPYHCWLLPSGSQAVVEPEEELTVLLCRPMEDDKNH